MFAEDLGHSDPMDGRKVLARAFGEYVDERRWTQADVVEKGGPSTTTQSKIRRNNGPISRQTLKLIDDVTGWPPGTAAAILSEGSVPAPTQSSEGDQGDLFDGISDLALLAELGKRLDRVARERSESDDAPAQPEMPTAGLTAARGSTPLGRQQPVQEPDLQPTSDQHGPDSRQ